LISASLYGISDEIHQSFVPERDGSLLDVVADVLGAVCGVYVYHRWVRSGKDGILKSEVGMRKSGKGRETEF